MAAELMLHVNKEDYLTKISQLDALLNKLRDLLSRYQALKNNVTKFVQDGDSNFEKMRDNVQANIEAVQRAIGITQQSKDTLQKTVDQMDEMGSKVGTLLQEGAETARNVISTAIRVDKLL